MRGKWIQSSYDESEKEIFKIHFLFCGFVGIFGFVTFLYSRFSDRTDALYKWLGGVVGLIIHYLAIWVVYLLEMPLNVIVFVCYYLFLILCAIFYKPDEIEERKKRRKEKETYHDFFANLYSEISFVNQLDEHCAIDLVIYALFKARLCALMNIYERDISEEKKIKVLREYDEYMYRSFCVWMEIHTKSFYGKAEILQNRMNTYEDISAKFAESPMVMCYVSNALYLYIADGWERNPDYTFSYKPKIYSSLFELIKGDRCVENKYAHIHDDVEFKTFSYCEKELSPFITSLIHDKKEAQRQIDNKLKKLNRSVEKTNNIGKKR